MMASRPKLGPVNAPSHCCGPRARAGRPPESRHRADVRRAPGGENELLAAKGGAALARREGRGGGQRRSRKEEEDNVRK